MLRAAASTLATAVVPAAVAAPSAGLPTCPRRGCELVEAFGRAEADPTVRVVVLTGRGRNFCVGADLSSGNFDRGDRPAAPDPDWDEPAGIGASADAIEGVASFLQRRRPDFPRDLPRWLPRGRGH